MKNLCTFTGTHKQNLYHQLCDLMVNEPIAHVLDQVASESIDGFYHHYVHDYVRSVHQVSHLKKEDEYKVSV